MSFNTFYTVVLGAAATLMGLLFFAVLFNADRRGHMLGERWLSVARSTLNIYVVLLLVPLVLLFPDSDDRLRAVIILVLVGFSIARQFMCWNPAWTIRSQRDLAPSLFWLFLGPISAFVLIGYSALTSFLWRVPFHSSTVSVVVLALFIMAIRNSWNLILQHAEVDRRTGARCLEGTTQRQFSQLCCRHMGPTGNR